VPVSKQAPVVTFVAIREPGWYDWPVGRIAVLAAATAFALVAAGAGGASAGACQPVSATASDAAASPAGPFVGTADFVIGGVEYPGVPEVTNVLAPLVPAGNSGVLATTTSHTLTIPGIGTVTTLDNARLVPTQEPGIYRLSTHAMLVGGATGELHVQATVNLATLTASGTYVGTICS
jgi:hypothetical protein